MLSYFNVFSQKKNLNILDSLWITIWTRCESLFGLALNHYLDSLWITIWTECHKTHLLKRMHSSRMRAAYLLTISPSIPCILGGLPNHLPECRPSSPRCRPPSPWMQTPPPVFRPLPLDPDPSVPRCRPPLPPDADPPFPQMQTHTPWMQTPPPYPWMQTPFPLYADPCDACWEANPASPWTDKHLWKYYLASNFVYGR